MNIQLLVALQEFVSEVKSEMTERTEFPPTTELHRAADRLDAVLHATIEAENARAVTFDIQLGG